MNVDNCPSCNLGWSQKDPIQVSNNIERCVYHVICKACLLTGIVSSDAMSLSKKLGDWCVRWSGSSAMGHASAFYNIKDFPYDVEPEDRVDVWLPFDVTEERLKRLLPFL